MIESLESRKLFAATLADASTLTTTPTADPAAATAFNFTKAESFSLNFSKIKYDMKVSQHDFHFVMKVNKPSPM